MPSSKRRPRHTVLWTTPALEDLLDIVQYIRSDNPPAAFRFGKLIRDRVASLARFPQAGRRVPEFPGSGLREVLIGDYRVIYRVVDTRRHVQILAVRHGARLLKNLGPRTE